MNRIFYSLLLMAVPVVAAAQEDYKFKVNVSDYDGSLGQYVPQKVTAEAVPMSERPRNVIFFIGDGMGLSHVYAALTANGGDLYLTQMTNFGFSRTNSASDYVTDSAAGGTALACGEKTYNGALGLNADSVPIPSIMHLCGKQGMATGVVATSTIVHATPGAFVSHVKNRSQYEDIALGFLDADIDFFMGGGRDFFIKRKDGRNLYAELEAKGYRMYNDLESAVADSAMRIGILTARKHTDEVYTRKPTLTQLVQKALSVLSQQERGFALMVEGSQIDWGGHQNDTRRVVAETLDMDKALGEALRFAARDGNTLVVVTADHETGGFSVIDGNMTTGEVKGAFTTGHHSAVMVPVYAYGPGAEAFRGIYHNTEVFHKIADLLAVWK